MSRAFLLTVVSLLFLSSCTNSSFDHKININFKEPDSSNDYLFLKYFTLELANNIDRNLKNLDRFEYNLEFRTSEFKSNISTKVLRETITVRGSFVVYRDEEVLFSFYDVVHTSYNLYDFRFEAGKVRANYKRNLLQDLAKSVRKKLLLSYNKLKPEPSN